MTRSTISEWHQSNSQLINQMDDSVLLREQTIYILQHAQQFLLYILYIYNLVIDLICWDNFK